VKRFKGIIHLVRERGDDPTLALLRRRRFIELPMIFFRIAGRNSKTAGGHGRDLLFCSIPDITHALPWEAGQLSIPLPGQ
jgi:hypothetical protein